MRPAVITVLVTLALLAAAPARAANMLRNPGAEAGAASPDGRTAVPVPGWETAGGFTVVAYGTPGFPATPAPESGARFFAGGAGDARATAVQEVRIAKADRDRVDLGRAQARLSVRLGSTLDEAELDTAGVQALFLDTDGGELARVAIDAVRAFGPTAPDVAVRPVPPGTRSIRVTMSAVRDRGSYDDGYFDDLSLSLRRASPPPPEIGRWVRVRAGGNARVKLAGRSSFIGLRGTALVPLGSEVDGRRARAVVVESATDGRGGLQKGTFKHGAFLVLQSDDDPLTELLLVEGNFGRCRTGAAARAAKTGFGSPVRKLFGSAKGRFRVSARYSAATVRGTVWDVIDTCTTTLTRVRRGTVQVDVFSAPVKPPSTGGGGGGGEGGEGGGGGGVAPSPVPITRRSTVTVKAGGSYSATGS